MIENKYIMYLPKILSTYTVKNKIDAKVCYEKYPTKELYKY